MRIDGWEQRLVAAIGAHQANAFVWGRWDCATLWRDAVVAMTGVDPLAHVRPWDSETGALRAVAHAGVRSVEEFLDWKFREIPVAQARRGDLIVSSAPATALSSPAVVLTGEALSRNEAGLIMVPAPMWRRAWSV